MPEISLAPAPGELENRLEEQRQPLIGYCYRMLGSPFEAEDAVQETLLRGWRSFNQFEGRAQLRSWLFRIATNVCLDMLKGRERRAMPMDFGAAREPIAANLHTRPGIVWIEPIPDSSLAAEADPAEVAVARETIRLAFIAALQHLPPRQRAVLILCEVLRWHASEVTQLLDISVASVNSALQRARATLASRGISAEATAAPTDEARLELLARYVEAFEQYNFDALTTLLQRDAKMSMPPYDMWLSGRDAILAWWKGPGIVCRGSRLVSAPSANGTVALGHYKPSASGNGFDPWALQVLELKGGAIDEFTFFLDTARLFPLFGLPVCLTDGDEQEPHGHRTIRAPAQDLS